MEVMNSEKKETVRLNDDETEEDGGGSISPPIAAVDVGRRRRRRRPKRREKRGESSKVGGLVRSKYIYRKEGGCVWLGRNKGDF